VGGCSRSRAVDNKVLVKLYSAYFYGNCAAYLTNIVRTVTAACSRSVLKSTSSSNFALPQLRSRFGERSFSHAGPSAWNALPSCCRGHESVQTSRQNSLFSLAFRVYYWFYFICILFTWLLECTYVQSVIDALQCTIWYYDIVSLCMVSHLAKYRWTIGSSARAQRLPGVKWKDLDSGGPASSL